MLEVITPGPLATIQDRGRRGYRHLGIPRSGAADRASHDLANRLVGNAEWAATIEITLGGAAIRFQSASVIALTGAPTPARAASRADSRPIALNCWQHVRAGERLTLTAPRHGLRTYLAIRGGIAAEPVLGSRATDTLTTIGPPKLAAGDLLRIGAADISSPAACDVAAGPAPAAVQELSFTPGTRREWFTASALQEFESTVWTLSSEVDRVGVRLDGPTLQYGRRDQPFSEGMVLGAIEVPPSGRPIVFMADHPTVGGYPVIGFVGAESVNALAQLRPGNHVRFRPWLQASGHPR